MWVVNPTVILTVSDGVTLTVEGTLTCDLEIEAALQSCIFYNPGTILNRGAVIFPPEGNEYTAMPLGGSIINEGGTVFIDHGFFKGPSCGTGTTLEINEFDQIAECVADATPEINCGTGTVENAAGDGCELTSVNAEIIAANPALIAENAALTTANAQLTSENTTLQSTIDGLNAQISSLNAQIATLQGDVSALNTQITSLNAQIASLTTENTMLLQMKANLDSQIATLQGQITALEGQITTLQGQLTAANATIAEQQETIEQLEASLPGSSSNAEYTEEQCAQFQEIADQLTAKDKSIPPPLQANLNSCGA